MATEMPRITDDWRDRLTEAAEQYHDASDHETGDGCDPDRMLEVRERVEQWAGPDDIVGMGEGRLVTHLPTEAFDDPAPEHEYVVKLPIAAEPYGDRDVAGLAQNGHERFVWEETESEYLLPVVDHQEYDWWLVMPRGASATGADGFEAWSDEAAAALGEYVKDSDITERNAVLHDGEFRLCDYGYPQPHF